MKKILSKITAIAAISSTLFHIPYAYASGKAPKSLPVTPIALIMPSTSTKPSFNDIIEAYQVQQGRQIISDSTKGRTASKSKLCPYHTLVELEKHYQIRCKTAKRTGDPKVMEEFRSQQVTCLEQLPEPKRCEVILELLKYRLERRPDDLDPDLARRLKIVETEGIKQSCSMKAPNLSFIGIVIETYGGHIVGFNI